MDEDTLHEGEPGEKKTERMGSFLARRLDKVDLIALFVDVIEVASHSISPRATSRRAAARARSTRAR